MPSAHDLRATYARPVDDLWTETRALQNPPDARSLHKKGEFHKRRCSENDVFAAFFERDVHAILLETRLLSALRRKKTRKNENFWDRQLRQNDAP